MQKFGIGEKYIEYVNFAYTDIATYVINNGYLSARISPERGVRQGCPLSCYLYLLIGEVLYRKIMKNKGIKGINIGGEIYKCSLLADDTTLFLDDEKSIVNSISLFKRF